METQHSRILAFGEDRKRFTVVEANHNLPISNVSARLSEMQTQYAEPLIEVLETIKGEGIAPYNVYGVTEAGKQALKRFRETGKKGLWEFRKKDSEES